MSFLGMRYTFFFLIYIIVGFHTEEPQMKLYKFTFIEYSLFFQITFINLSTNRI